MCREQHCTNPYLPLEEIQTLTEDSELPRKFNISNLHETNLQHLHFEGRPGTHSEPQATIKKDANITPVATLSYYSIY